MNINDPNQLAKSQVKKTMIRLKHNWQKIMNTTLINRFN